MMDGDELRAKAVWCAEQAAKAQSQELKTYLLKLETECLALANAQIGGLAEHMSDGPPYATHAK